MYIYIYVCEKCILNKKKNKIGRLYVKKKNNF